ncbi:Lrp/AsnC ligand binding domain-containing protein [Ferruginivarius sediminum]|uniref:Winged helix-turn-helix transcriptional regulator n=1 Tax=Ferruginivarius sediminum TaxID=2661937 RepID=A0A369TFU1_9PROT|nr:Lrp/AsnC ligand binding domain-containing protein [Ferruginivarius sediminum]RDD63682.1 winged helix-turn-helix transcriptional regulator [Ferruginivarius sediminum]
MSAKDRGLDHIDLAILRALQGNGRLTNVELARRVNLSPTPCLERTRRLEREGYIAGYAALLDRTKLGAAMTVFVEVELDRTTPDVFDRFKEAVTARPEVLECHLIAGGFDYLVKVALSDMDAYRDFLGGVLVSMPGVKATHTYVVMEEVKATTEVPLPDAPG